jgi:hypothetical protein
MIYLAHILMGLVFAATGWGVRSLCQHKGLLPHPKWQVPITVLLVVLEAIVTVPLVG